MSAAAAITAAGLAIGCEATKSSNPLTPTVAGPIPGVTISAPKTLEPGAGRIFDPDQPALTLLAENASSNSPRPLLYAFEVATDAAFATKVFTKEGVAQGDNGRTSVKMSDPPANGKTYYWRVKAYDGVNTGPFSAPSNYGVQLPIVIEPPVALSPVSGVVLETTKPTFRFRNSGRSGPVGTVSYVVQVSGEQTFVQSIVINNVGEQPNETSVPFPSDLPFDGKFFWRVHAMDVSTASIGPWSATQQFGTPKPPPPPPAPTPSPSPSPGPGTPAPDSNCRGSSPIGILNCVRDQFPRGEMSHSSLEQFILRSVTAFKASGIPGGPYGRLVKTSGNNCGGFSCDIICVGQGPGQLQYDVLIAEDIPTWGAPISGPGIRVDVCQVP